MRGLGHRAGGRPGTHRTQREEAEQYLTQGRSALEELGHDVEERLADLPEAQAVSRLWDDIFKVTRADLPDPVAAWQEHVAALARVARDT